MPQKELAEMRRQSELFKKRFAYASSEDDPYVPEHAIYSREYAKTFTGDEELLDLIQFHDTGWKLFATGNAYTPQLLKKYYAGRDVRLYVLFSFVDAANRGKNIPSWLQEQCLKNDLLDERAF